jgi:peptide/nickel transport system substrate-binding protein
MMGRMPRIVLPALVVACLISSCAGPAFTDADVVTVALDQPPINLDPRIGLDANSQRLAELLFNSLVKKNERLDIEPDLALSWDMPDAQTYVFMMGAPLQQRMWCLLFAAYSMALCAHPRADILTT